MSAVGKSHGTEYRGPALVHAAQTKVATAWTRHAFREFWGVDMPEGKLSFGCIIGLVDVIDCRPAASTPGNFPRPNNGDKGWIWFVEKPRRIEPIRYAGKGALWVADLVESDLHFIE